MDQAQIVLVLHTCPQRMMMLRRIRGSEQRSLRGHGLKKRCSAGKAAPGGFALKVAGVVRQVQNHRTSNGRGCHSSDVPWQGSPPPLKHKIRGTQGERELRLVRSLTSCIIIKLQDTCNFTSTSNTQLMCARGSVH